MPQEEEILLAKTTPFSWYTQFLFPKQAVEMLDLGVVFDRTPGRIRQEIKREYLDLLRAASHLDGDRRLLLNSAANTARISMLLSLFPDAKFVVMHRSPYEVFSATTERHRNILEQTSLQSYDDELIKHNVLTTYEQVMKAYLADRMFIPPRNLVEVGYADLAQNPRAALKGIYAALDLQRCSSVEKSVAATADKNRDRQRALPLDKDDAALIEDRWAFAFEALGYPRRHHHFRSTASGGAEDPVGDELIDLAG